MVSKKVIASTLAGTKALGLSGALAWALGLFDGEGLENVLDGEMDVNNSELVSEPELQEDVPLGPENPEQQEEATRKDSRAGAEDDKDIQLGEVGARSGGTSTLKRFFSDDGESSEQDRRVVNSNLIWEINWKEGLDAITIQIEEKETNFLWWCHLKAVSIDGLNPSGKRKGDYSEFERQKGELEKALEDKNKKEQFVKNCSKARIDEEVQRGQDGTIELETENVNGIWDKFKFKESNKHFERVWSEDFTGIERIKKEDEWLLESNNTKKINVERGTKVKVEIASADKNWSCYISGNYGGDLRSRTFKDKDEKLKDILNKYKNGLEIEKKKYLIRNCKKNSMAITGLKVEANGSNWWFEEASLEKISQGMYENPTET